MHLVVAIGEPHGFRFQSEWRGCAVACGGFCPRTQHRHTPPRRNLCLCAHVADYLMVTQEMPCPPWTPLGALCCTQHFIQ